MDHIHDAWKKDEGERLCLSQTSSVPEFLGLASEITD